MDNKQAVIIVGAGGIGSALFQDLCRFLPHMLDIHLVDGDTVEGKNLQRQHFGQRDKGRNKAEALAEKASVAIGLDRVYFHPNYLIEPVQLERIARNYADGVILVGCVDNHPARRVMEQFVRASVGRWVYYVDCANDESHGQVVSVYTFKDRIAYGQFRSELDPDVLTDNTGDPTAASCNQQLDAGNVQVLYTNRKAAILALELVHQHLQGDTRVGIAYFKECVTPRMKGVVPGGAEAVVSSSRKAKGGRRLQPG